jgi:hypothetical protein
MGRLRDQNRRYSGTTYAASPSGSPEAGDDEAGVDGGIDRGCATHPRLGIETEPKHVEGIRAKCKKLVTRGLLTEDQPGLFTLTTPRTKTDETQRNTL